ncbi:MAG TPA: hypothetical protein VNF73_14780, partial [Candidatus Saccharimonadales bacterium]|nr:hypothetical protein [Candidatus Saccharimonadales bacterium]
MDLREDPARTAATEPVPESARHVPSVPLPERPSDPEAVPLPTGIELARSAAPRSRPPERRSLRRRIRAGAIDLGASLVGRLPEGPLIVLADVTGELWYRAAPRRAAQARLNLGRVCASFAAQGRGSDRVRAAATDPAALEGLVRSAFRHAARYYLEVA